MISLAGDLAAIVNARDMIGCSLVRSRDPGFPVLATAPMTMVLFRTALGHSAAPKGIASGRFFLAHCGRFLCLSL